MILKNPTDQVVSIQIEGAKLSVLPNEEIKVSDAQGEAWLRVHGFLVRVGTDAEPIVIPKAPKEETITEEVFEGIEEEEPKKPLFKKAKK